MNRDKYDEIVAKVVGAWPPDRIQKMQRTETRLECENGTFIKIVLMQLTEKMLNDPEVPQRTKDMLHNKLLIQWTDDWDKTAFSNLGFYIEKDKWPENEQMKEALKELSMRVQIGSILT